MSLKIIKTGVLATIQDTGRYGYQHLGINPTGAMDRYACQLANALLGKELYSPVIEFHFPAPVFLFEKDAIISITGGNFSPIINNEPLEVNTAVIVRKNSVLKFRRMIVGARCYLSILPELRMEKWMNSFSTHLKAVAGGWEGRALKEGDQLDFKNTINHKHSLNITHHPLESNLTSANILQVLPGMAWEEIAARYKDVFLNDVFKITRLADRMGYRLSGKPVVINNKEEMISTAVTFGTIQVLTDGQLVVLMADHQTTGGYPQIAHVISADLSILAQKQSGDSIRFTLTDMKSAEKKLKEQINYLNVVKAACKTNLEKL